MTKRQTWGDVLGRYVALLFSSWERCYQYVPPAYGALQAEKYVMVEVTDTGTGMDENVQSKIFEPFFTTKDIGQGTGLGLAVAYGVVNSRNCFIQVRSQPLRGTTFRVCFPVVSPGD